jgi:hypothetical protein
MGLAPGERSGSLPRPAAPIVLFLLRHRRRLYEPEPSSQLLPCLFEQDNLKQKPLSALHDPGGRFDTSCRVRILGKTERFCQALGNTNIQRPSASSSQVVVSGVISLVRRCASVCGCDVPISLSVFFDRLSQGS